jgi:hypothetical protein
VNESYIKGKKSFMLLSLYFIIVKRKQMILRKKAGVEDIFRYNSVKTFARSCIIYFVLLLASSYSLMATAHPDTLKKISPATTGQVPEVYLDCRRCDFDYIRKELNFVHYVRDPNQADIHVFVTDHSTGDGGRMFEFSFFGRRGFSGTEYTLKHIVGRDATTEETRQALARFLKLGLASYMLQTSQAANFTVKYTKNGEVDSERIAVKDPWKNWVFQAYLGSIKLDMESNKNEFNSRWGFFADKITEDWKFRIRPYFNYDQTKIQTTAETEPVISKRHRGGLDSYAIKSLGEHWSAGVFGDYLTFNGRNIRHEFRLTPGIEYSILPYEVATRRSITLRYLVGYSYFDYYRETVFGKSKESLFNHQIKGMVNIKKPWGSIETGFEGSHYFHDFSKRRIEFYGQLSVRVVEGLSVSFQTDYNVVNDQLALPRGEATLEEVLLKQRELATNFSLSSSIAISYTFGSKYANIVNTRF